MVTFVYKKILRILSKNNVCESIFIKTEYIVLGDFLAISETSCYNETRYGKKHPEITGFSQGQKRFCLCFLHYDIRVKKWKNHFHVCMHDRKFESQNRQT